MNKQKYRIQSPSGQLAGIHLGRPFYHAGAVIDLPARYTPAIYRGTGPGNAAVVAALVAG